MTETWRAHLTDEQLRYLGALWGKSDRDGGEVNLLVQHLFDAMAVGELIWDRYLAPGPKDRLDAVGGGDGRRLLAWLCGAHDWGKASPAFQSQAPHLAARVEAAGLTGAVSRDRIAPWWRHERAGALIARERLAEEWSEADHVRWVWPLIAGHHGVFPPLNDVSRRKSRRKGRDLHGPGASWDAAHRAVVDAVTVACGYPDVAAVQPTSSPSKADQLLLSGLIVMADWIASNDACQAEGVNDLARVSVEGARQRASRAWAELQICGGWGRLAEPPAAVIHDRFGKEARPSQSATVAAAQAMGAPGLLIVEAPTGEGKTEGSLAAAEVLAARFGADGVYVGLPTQATSDPMFTRVRRWLASFDAVPPVALLHGKRRFNPEWKRLTGPHQAEPDPEEVELDEYGVPIEIPPVRPPSFGGICEEGCPGEEMGAGAAARWFLGSYRGLLSPNGVGTIDQVLYAGTCTHHVMLRYAGLAGKVVILDEVHAADIYMSQFLGEVLAWLGQGQVPVVLLSATLAPAQRQHLAESYLKGALGEPDVKAPWAAEVDGYPAALAVWGQEGVAHHSVHTAVPWRPPSEVDVVVLDEPEDGSVDAVVDLLVGELADGGCALVIRNTVGRAQDTYTALREHLEDDEVVLLHSRFTAARRAEVTEDLLHRLGDGGARPSAGARLVVVATQIAEQSFDVDADLLVSDLAPVDLLVQRAGRLHRHDRPVEARPEGLRRPRLVVTGVDASGAVPTFPRASEIIYSHHLLLQTTALVLEATRSGGWSLPTQVPDLVGRAYGPADLGPEAWAATAAGARRERDSEMGQAQRRARDFLLTPSRSWTSPTLEGLHQHASTARDVEGLVKVRDGDMGAEVVLVQHVDGRYRTLGGRDLGVNADAGRDHAEEVLGATVRLPAHGQFRALTAAAGAASTLPAWHDDPWLRWTPVVVLDGDHRGALGDFSLRYDAERGLAVERTR